MSDKEKAAYGYLTWVDKSPDVRPSAEGEETFLAGAEWATPRWIKCSERVPEIDGAYAIYAPSMDKDCPLIMTAYYHESVGWSMLPQVWIDAITHWMPLPEAPKEEES